MLPITDSALSSLKPAAKMDRPCSACNSAVDSSPQLQSSAACKACWRRTPAGDLEVYWARRAPTMPFMGGWYAFPGGGVARGDAAVPVAGEPRATAERDPDETVQHVLSPHGCPGRAGRVCGGPIA